MQLRSAKGKVQSSAGESCETRLLTFHFALRTLHFRTCAQGVRERIRSAPRATSITESQANELTLTVTQVAVRPIQVWVRTAGVIDASGKTLQATISKADATFVKPGQRVRAFPPEARSSMFQARVAGVAPKGDRVGVTVALIAPARQGSPRYVLEIVTEEVERMSVPNEAIIETGDKRVVYVKDADTLRAAGDSDRPSGRALHRNYRRL